MPYKKESPFANFRDPKRSTKNYNPTNFQMPDISSIYSKTADGEKVDEVDDTKSTGNSDTDLINKGEKAKKEATEGPVTRKSLRQNRRAGEKEFNKELSRNRRLSKASSKDITAEERDFYERATRDIQKEKDFRKKAAKMGENPADVMLKPMKTIEGGNVSTEKSKIPTRPGGNIESGNQMRFQPVIPGEGTPKSFSEKEMEEYKKSKGLNMKQVNTKGSGFPMVSPLNAVTAGNEMADQSEKQAINKQMQPMQNTQQNAGYGDPTTTQTPNRAGKGQNSNVLTSDPNINQPANKVPASTDAQNKFFSQKASSSQAPNPVMPPNMVPATTPGMSSGVGSPAGTFTSTGQGGSGATGINRENLFLNEAAAMYSDGPSKALVGNQDRLPEHLKAKIEAAPGMYGDDRKKPTANEMKKDGTSVNISGTNSPDFGKSNKTIKSNSPKKTMKMFGSETLYKQNKSYNDAFKSYEDSTKAFDKDLDRFMEGDTSAGKYPMPKLPKYKDHFEKLPGMYSPFEFTPGGKRTEVGKRSKGGKTTTVYRKDGSKKSEFTEKDSGTKKETRYTASPRSLKGKAVKVDVKDNATRTYTKYKRDGSVKKTMTANNKGGVDIDKSAKLRAKNRRSKKGTKLK